MPPRPALTHERIIDAAVQVADRGGVAGVSMRNVGKELGVEAMSLYHHIDGKDALLDALTDWVFARIELPDPKQPWRSTMTDLAASARRTLSQHPWALGLIESRRSPGPALLRHHDTVLACLRTNGFSVPMAAHAFSAIDAYVYGFVLTEVNLPFEPGESAEQFVEEIADMLPADEYPFLVELIGEQVAGRDYSYGDEFDFGLELILDGLERRQEDRSSGMSTPDRR
jgi:AcrR family transcriptional regulator